MKAKSVSFKRGDPLLKWSLGALLVSLIFIGRGETLFYLPPPLGHIGIFGGQVFRKKII